jgi:hypothetical protein
MSANPAVITVSNEKKIYEGTAARVLKLLGAGCLASEAAKACGVSEGYVSQLKNEPDFMKQLNDIITKAMSEQSVIDENYNDIELQMTKRIRETCQYVFDPEKAMRLAKFANEAKRRINPINKINEGESSSPGNDASRSVTLILPVQVVNEFIVSPQGEIVGVNGVELKTLPSKNITDLVAKHKREEREVKQGFKIMDKQSGSGQTDPYSDL